MLRSRLLVTFASPLLAASMLMPSVALASPYARSVPVIGMQEVLATPVPGQTPTRVEPPPPAAPGSQGQLTVGGTQQGQSTLSIPPTPPGGTTIIVQPQIQIGGNVAPTSSADSNVNTNTNSTATPQVTTNTTSTATPAVTTNTSTSTAPVSAPPVYAPPPQQRYPQQRTYAPPPAPPRIVTRVVSRPSAAPAPVAYRTPPAPRKGLMITGWVLFSVSYLITASNAADLYDRCPQMRHPGKCRDLSENMFIPVVGPFLAMEQARFATDDFSLAVSGSLQGLGLLMGIVGTVQFHRDRYRNRVLNEYGVRVGKRTALGASSRLGGGQLTLTGRF